MRNPLTMISPQKRNRKGIIFSIFFLLSFGAFSQWTQLGNPIFSSEASFYEFGSHVSLNESGDHIVFTSGEYLGGGDFNYYAYVYQFNNNNWVLKGQPIPLEAKPNVAIINSEGDQIAIGMKTYVFNNSYYGKVSILNWTGSTWEEIDTISGSEANEQLGSSLAYDEINNRYIIGVPGYLGNTNEIGKVSIYQWNGTQYIETQTIIGTGHGFAEVLSISADGSVIGVPAYTEDVGSDIVAGRIYIYQWTGTTYELKGNPIPGTQQLDGFGLLFEMSDDGNTFSARGKDAIYVYDWTNTIWFQRGNVIDLEDFYTPTLSLSADGTKIAFGNPFHDGGGSSAGRVRVFQWENNSWNQVGLELQGNTQDQFGYKVSFSNSASRIAIYASEEFKSQPTLGYVKVYENLTLETTNQDFKDNSIFIINPVKNKLQLSFERELKNAEILVFDSTGRQLKSWYLDNSILVTLDFPFPSGTYILKVIDENGFGCYKRVIKQ
ncbi:MAG: T9SS type A sorting domain-containing protein [Flavobacteriaceae bacterium]